MHFFSAFRGPADDVDHSISSLGPFLDLLFEKVELMPNNNLETNLLVTSLISQLASYPHPLLRAVLIHPDIVLQPSVRGLFTAIGKKYALKKYDQFALNTKVEFSPYLELRNEIKLFTANI